MVNQKCLRQIGTKCSVSDFAWFSLRVFENFLATPILCEIRYGYFAASKTAILTLICTFVDPKIAILDDFNLGRNVQFCQI